MKTRLVIALACLAVTSLANAGPTDYLTDDTTVQMANGTLLVHVGDHWIEVMHVSGTTVISDCVNSKTKSVCKGTQVNDSHVIAQQTCETTKEKGKMCRDIVYERKIKGT